MNFLQQQSEILSAIGLDGKFTTTEDGIKILLGMDKNLMALHIENKDETMFKFLDIVEENDFVFDDTTFIMDNLRRDMTFLFKLTSEQKTILSKFQKKTELFGLDCQAIFSGSISAIYSDDVGNSKFVEAVKPCKLPEWLFEEIIKKDYVLVKKYLETMFEKKCGDVLCAKIFYQLNKYDFMYDAGQWYFLTQYGTWEQDNEAICVEKRIDDVLAPFIEDEYILFVNNLARQVSVDAENERLKKKLKKAYLDQKNASDFFGIQHSKVGILKALKNLYEHKGLFEKLDNVNDYLIGFNNGVYDLENFEFRKGKPSEFVATSCGYNFSTKESASNTLMHEKVAQILNDTFPIEEELDYVMKILSLGLIGKNPLEQIWVWLGSGANGKGVLLHMLKQALGAYYDDMDINYLTQKEVNARGADPVMASKKNSRLCISTEPSGGCEINDGIVKKITGSDGYSCRQLYKASFSYTPKFKLHIQTNCLFTIDGADGGNARRYVVIPFKSKFVDVPTGQFEKKINRNLKSEIMAPKFKNAFIQILIKYYAKYVSEGAKLPESFASVTKEFLGDNDPIGEFARSHIIKTTDSKDRIKMSAMYNNFGEYFKKAKINLSKFKQALSNLGFINHRYNNGLYWINVKRRDCEDEIEE